MEWSQTDIVRGAYQSALIVNADDLIGDAELLLKHGSFGRAMSLAIMATEELGKVEIIDNATDATDSALKKLLRDHRVKLEAAVFAGVEPTEYLVRAADNPEEALRRAVQGYIAGKALAKRNHDDRMAGLYVDLVEGELLQPVHVTHEQAEEAIARAKGLRARVVA